MIAACFLMLFCLACKSVPENWHIYVIKGLIYLLYFIYLIDLTIRYKAYLTDFFIEISCFYFGVHRPAKEIHNVISCNSQHFTT